MSNAKSLSDEQIKTIQDWADAGDGLPEIQQKLGSELDFKVTYLETRFLLEDLKIELKPEPVPEPEEEPEAEPEPQPEQEVPGDAPSEDAAAEIPTDDGPAETVTVTIDTVLRPGAIVSGRATFSGGNAIAWWLDQTGQLGMDADGDFKPSETQLMAFQRELQKTIQESGL